MAALYAGYNVTITTSDSGTLPDQPYQTVYFGGEVDYLLGASSYIDPRNETLTGSALVATETVVDTFPGLKCRPDGPHARQCCDPAVGASARTQAHRGPDRRHGASLSVATSSALEFTTSPLYGDEQYNGQIGLQDAPTLLSELGG